MALLDYEHFFTETNLSYPNWWTSVVGFNLSVSAAGQGPYGYGRYVGISAANGNELNRFSAFPPTHTLFFQCHVMFTGPGTAVATFKDGVTQQGFIQLQNDFTIGYRLGGFFDPLVVKTTKTFPLNAWLFLQVKIVFSNLLAGSVEIKVGGLSEATIAGVKTAKTANDPNGWSLQANAARITNIVIYNNLGNAPNAFTDETIIYVDMPTGAGAVTQWTPSAGANWENVDEIPADNDTTYNSAPAAGLDDLYTFPAIVPVGTQVLAVGQEMDARKDAAGTDLLDSLIKSGVTTAAQGSNSLSTTYERFKTFWDLDPDTGLPWVVADANNAQIGVRRTL